MIKYINIFEYSHRYGFMRELLKVFKALSKDDEVIPKDPERLRKAVNSSKVGKEREESYAQENYALA
jgi:hypothetical protein